MKPGDRLDNRYLLVRQIGVGGMGTIWEAKHVESGLHVAIKAMHDHLMTEARLLSRFVREAQASLEARRSGHIIELMDLVQPMNRAPYLVMEYLDGDDLSHILRQEGALQPGRAVYLARQVCHALAEVHRRDIVHRDIKPENLYVVHRDDGSEWIKILDFGVAKFNSSLILGETPLTADGMTVGTPFYMAPEQVLSGGRVDHRSDIYATGVVLYELLTGRRPYNAADISELVVHIAQGRAALPTSIRPSLDRKLEAIVLKAMSLEPAARHQSMDELAAALEPHETRSIPKDRPAVERGEPLSTPNSSSAVHHLPTQPLTRSLHRPAAGGSPAEVRDDATTLQMKSPASGKKRPLRSSKDDRTTRPITAKLRRVSSVGSNPASDNSPTIPIQIDASPSSLAPHLLKVELEEMHASNAAVVRQQVLGSTTNTPFVAEEVVLLEQQRAGDSHKRGSSSKRSKSPSSICDDEVETAPYDREEMLEENLVMLRQDSLYLEEGAAVTDVELQTQKGGPEVSTEKKAPEEQKAKAAISTSQGAKTPVVENDADSSPTSSEEPKKVAVRTRAAPFTSAKHPMPDEPPPQQLLSGRWKVALLLLFVASMGVAMAVVYFDLLGFVSPD